MYNNPFKANTFAYMAHNDYMTAMLNYDLKSEYVYDNILVNCHQFVEKLLKHIINSKTGQINKTHNLKSLSRDVMTHYPKAKKIWRCCSTLNDYYFSKRYPGENYYETDKEQVEEAIECIKNIKELLYPVVENMQ
jgi:HEPN domain-containing protein